MKLAKTLNTWMTRDCFMGLSLLQRPEVYGEDIYKAIPQGDILELRFKRRGLKNGPK
jgi:hypothetical protein